MKKEKPTSLKTKGKKAFKKVINDSLFKEYVAKQKDLSKETIKKVLTRAEKKLDKKIDKLFH